ncbi:Importin subunit alpha [Quillaja saponaria]|uniref:Importin subunit alpha n=1 Tax=Quillaja saponaria TaxID=32244 RepID=A0AAD7LWB9_QUISA|nr:Importin subunit alpha [Quillaja saponaria]
MRRLDPRQENLQSMKEKRKFQRESILFFKEYEKNLNAEQQLMEFVADPLFRIRFDTQATDIFSSLCVEDVAKIRFLLSTDNPPIDKIIASGVIPQLIEFLGEKYNPSYRLEAASALFGIVSGTVQQANAVVELGGVPIFVQLLRNDHLKKRAVFALGCIAISSPGFRDHVLGQGCLAPLLEILMEHSKPSMLGEVNMLQNASRTLAILCFGIPPPPFDQVKHALPTLQKLIHLEPSGALLKVCQDACLALSCLSNGPTNQIQAVIDANILERLVMLLSHAPKEIVDPLLRTVGNILRGSDFQIQALIHNHVFVSLHQLLTGKSTESSVLKEICSTISIMTSGDSDRIREAIAADLIRPLLRLQQNNDTEEEVKLEAVCAISLATRRGSNAQIKYLVHQGCIGPFCDFLTCQDRTTLIRCLDGLKNIIEAGEAEKAWVNPYVHMINVYDGISKIEKLRSHPDVGETAEKIINIYWRTDFSHFVNENNLLPNLHAA